LKGEKKGKNDIRRGKKYLEKRRNWDKKM